MYRLAPALSLFLASAAWAEPMCRSVEMRFAPGAPNLQIVVWIEDAQGKVVDTAYITRLTGQFGLANRPGEALLKTDFRWPFGRREMVAPVWAHRRNKHYRKVVMGGACGNKPGPCYYEWSNGQPWGVDNRNAPKSYCPDNTVCGCECEDSTIAYHSRVSSYEPFYCSPSGASKIDAMSCASKGTFPKGAYADLPEFSLYPPRADLVGNSPSVDSADALDFAKQNDLVAISRATPLDGKPMNPAVTWFPADTVPDGDYVAWIELSQESDFNGKHNHPNKPDTVQAWDFEGRPFLGQPSVLYKVPFHLGPEGFSGTTAKYAGYGDWAGKTGTLHPPDGTITENVPGSGAGRLLEQNDGADVYRMKVVVGPCGAVGDGGVGDGGVPPMCLPPEPVSSLQLEPTASAIKVGFRAPTGGPTPNRYSVRYREHRDGDPPVTETTFDLLLAALDPPLAGTPGAPLSTTITTLMPSTAYVVAVRAITACNKGSQVVSAIVATPAQKFATLQGCFVATAAYGTPMAAAVDSLRAFRDERLLAADNAAGRLFVATYYGLSPPLAQAIAADRRLRAAARAALRPIVDLVERR